MKKQEILKLISDYNNLKDLLEDLVEKIYTSAVNNKQASGFMESFELTKDQILVKWEESWSYGGYDSGIEEFPINLLWDDYEKYFSDIKNEYDEKVRKEKELEVGKAKKVEYQKYLNLKDKYEKT